jgi:beta-N-acetylhexosaminidase
MFSSLSSLSALKALLVLSLALCVAAPAPSAAPIPTGCGTERLDRMIGQMILVGFPGDDENDAGVRAVREQLNKGIIGGVVLFPENIHRRKQVKHLIAFLRNAHSNPRPFIAVDQEGGKVQRLNPWNGFKWIPAAAKVAANPSFASPEAAERLYGEMAAELADAGFNMNLGPVVDLNTNPRNPVIGARGRSFGADPDVVTSLAGSFIKAHRAANIVTVAKHFPGHGSSVADSHRRLADVSETWRETELRPYRRLAADGLLDAVMIGHLYHPRFSDREALPASLSAKASDALRNEN